MSDRFVIVASYHFPLEAQMAKNLLETEGIHAFLAGELTGDTLNGLGQEVHLQVHEQDARRAVSVLASVSAEASLDDDWEARAESGAGVWTCSLCGTPVPLDVAVCPACQTPNANVTTNRLDTWTAAARARRQPDEPKSGQVQAEPPRSPPTGAAEGREGPAPKSGAGCLVLFCVLTVLPAWLLWR